MPGPAVAGRNRPNGAREYHRRFLLPRWGEDAILPKFATKYLCTPRNFASFNFAIPVLPPKNLSCP